MERGGDGLGNGTAPVGDAAFDALAELIGRMIDERVARFAARLGEVTAAPTGADARVAVRVWDDEGDGQERVARTAGVELATGDTVVVLPVGSADSWVVVSKVVYRTADRASVSAADLMAGAVGADQLAGSAVTTAKLANLAVATAKIEDGAVTPVKLSKAYATPAEVSTAVSNGVSGLASKTYVDNQVGTRAPAASDDNPYAREKWVSNNFQPKGSGGGRVAASSVDVASDTSGTTDLQSLVRNLSNFMVCTNNNLKGGKKKPCTKFLSLFG